jgi:Domain of unknown function (DUF222)
MPTSDTRFERMSDWSEMRSPGPERHGTPFRPVPSVPGSSPAPLSGNEPTLPHPTDTSVTGRPTESENTCSATHIDAARSDNSDPQEPRPNRIPGAKPVAEAAKWLGRPSETPTESNTAGQDDDSIDEDLCSATDTAPTGPEGTSPHQEPSPSDATPSPEPTARPTGANSSPPEVDDTSTDPDPLLSGATHVQHIRDLTARIAAIEAERLTWVASLHDRPEMLPLPARERASGSRYRDLTPYDLLLAEIQAALHLGRAEADRLCEAAITLTSRMPATLQALREGRLDYRRAALIGEQTQPLADHHRRQATRAGLSPEAAEAAATAVAGQVEDLILDDAPAMTWWELKTALLKALITVDPLYVEQTRKDAQRGRRVSARTNPDDATGELHAYLGAAETQAIYTIIDTYARLARHHGDPRTLDQLRADALTAICLNGPLPTPNGDSDSHSASEAERDSVDGSPERDGDYERHGDGVGDNHTEPDADACEDTDEDDSRHDGDDTNRSEEPVDRPEESYLPVPEADAFPPAPDACNDHGHDHVDETNLEGTASTSPPGGLSPRPAPRPPDDEPDPRPSKRKSQQPDSATRSRSSGWSGLRSHLQVLIDLDTLLRLNDRPATLVGHGPITPDYARALAGLPQGLFRRLITDPGSGQLLEYGSTTYRVPARLKAFVHARDQVCRHPGCTRAATSGDADHVVPFPAGATCEENLCSQCRRDHRLKHEGHWTHSLSTDPAHPPGSVVIVSPTGQRYLSPPAVLTRPIPLRPRRPENPRSGGGSDLPDQRSARARYLAKLDRYFPRTRTEAGPDTDTDNVVPF